MKRCSLPGCERRHQVQGLCGMHYQRKYRGSTNASPVSQKNFVDNRKIEHPLYDTWKNIRQRCMNPNAPNYKYYGAKGVRVCERWLSDFWNFVADMGERPDPTYTVDRKNNDGDYTPENCRWATKSEQRRNQRLTHYNKRITI